MAKFCFSSGSIGNYEQLKAYNQIEAEIVNFRAIMRRKKLKLRLPPNGNLSSKPI